jgi:hypothetical protein
MDIELRLLPGPVEFRPARFPLTAEDETLTAKRVRALALLGDRWLLHPSHSVRRLPEPEPGPIETEMRCRKLRAGLGWPKDVVMTPEARAEVIQLLTRKEPRP